MGHQTWHTIPHFLGVLSLFLLVDGFRYNTVPSSTRLSQSVLNGEKTNKAMEFLRKIGKVGGKANKDYRFALGVDEGPSGKAMSSRTSSSDQLKKTAEAYPSCVASGCIDDISQPFPSTSCGSEWAGFTDTVMGGVSQASLAREPLFHGRTANVLRGRVSMLNGGGFVQMACFLHPLQEQVDASMYDGIEIDVACEAEEPERLAETFNVHLKTASCTRPFSSYRASFEAPTNGEWNLIRVPWECFHGHGPGASDNPLDVSSLLRAGIVAIGKPMKVVLGISSVRFYKQAAVQ